MNDHASLEKAQPTSYDDLLDRDSRQVPASLRRRGVTDIGPIEIPTRWYTDAVIHEREVERIWKTRRSEEHTSELQSLMRISYAVFCLKKKKIKPHTITITTPNNI